MNHRRLIEEWLPIKEIGIESRRERGASSALPALYFLHVWWARRPLTASRAAILGSLLPAWEGNREILGQHFASEDEYYQWFLRMLGIPAGTPGIDPVSTAEAILKARDTGENLGPNPYGYSRAFGRQADAADFATFRSITEAYGFKTLPTVMDPMSGGGSIPFESVRLGLPTIANELNPVASLILEATVRYPLTYGQDLIELINHWANRWGDLIEKKLKDLYPLPEGENAIGYIWARTVPCPTTGKPVPLSPNWWLRRKPADSVAVNLLPCESDWSECRFEVVRGTQADLEKKYAPSKGTIASGSSISPWSGDPVPSDYIKRMAQEGQMGAQLFALCVDQGKGRDFRLPTDADLAGIKRAKAALDENWDRWLAAGLIPTEEFPQESNDLRPLIYGMDRWHKLFAPRQLLAMITYLETLRELASEMEQELGQERAAAVRTYLAFILDKCANWNSILATWNAPYVSIRSVFDRHDFSFKWSFAEMNMALKDKGAFPWALSQVVDAYQGLCRLVVPSLPLVIVDGDVPESTNGSGTSRPVQITRGSATALSHLADASVDAVVVDPPYGNNVMYAELSDFFYVWLKRSVGDIYPDWFDAELVDKDSEAVANPARFTEARGGKAAELATRDYLLKMRRVFREMRRVVKPGGSMTVMFTHRETDMWNALGLALLETGWEIGSSWPVHTESEHSLHIAQKNAARSTVLLFCRPRQTAETQSFWDQDLRNEVTRTAGERAREFQEAGIDGVDLYLSTFGPVLGVLSRHWPIISEDVDRETGESLPLEPEAALTIARREVFRLQREGLLDGRAANWDAATDWYLLAWKSFGAREFSYDEARKMAMAQGAEGDELRTRHRLLSQKSGTAALLQPGQRQSRDHVNPEAVTFTRAVDALHTAMWLYDTEGERRCRQFLEGTGLIADSDFQTLFQAALNAIPRTRKYTRGQITGFNVPEAETLENMRLSLFPDIEFTEKLDTNTGAEQAALDIG